MATHPGPSTPHIVDDIGDYVDAEDEQDVECESEPRARYIWDKSISSRWYCPIRIGDVLHQQYRIEHKVGWGGFSTVWLARDLKTNLLVSLKVLCNSPHAQSEHRINLDILARCGPDISEYLVVLQTAFHLRNPDRIPLSPQYRVLVLPVRGPSLKTACFKIRPAVRILAARHLLLAIKRLHDAEIIHADINAGAAMWDIEPIAQWSTAEIYQRISRPQKVRLRDDKNRHIGDLVGEWNTDRTFPSSLLRPSLSLGDFSHAVLASDVKKSIQWPVNFCAPERFHDQETSFASDMWGFMLIFFQLYTGVALGNWNGANFVSLLVAALGPFPEEWKGKCTLDGANDWWYDQTGQIPPSIYHSDPCPTIEAKLAWYRPDAIPEERELAAQVIRKGLRYRPEERMTAAQLLEDPSFNSLLTLYRGEVS